MLCAKQAAAAMTGVGGSVVFVANAGDRGLTDGAGNVVAISSLTSSAAAAAGPDGVRVNCVTHALGGHEDDGRIRGGHGTFSLATMRTPSAEDVAMQVRGQSTRVCKDCIIAETRYKRYILHSSHPRKQLLYSFEDTTWCGLPLRISREYPPARLLAVIIVSTTIPCATR